eukprot:1175419-Prorocentrum_minimum.AAC.2
MLSVFFVGCEADPRWLGPSTHVWSSRCLLLRRKIRTDALWEPRSVLLHRGFTEALPGLTEPSLGLNQGFNHEAALPLPPRKIRAPPQEQIYPTGSCNTGS